MHGFPASLLTTEIETGVSEVFNGAENTRYRSHKRAYRVMPILFIRIPFCHVTNKGRRGLNKIQNSERLKRPNKRHAREEKYEKKTTPKDSKLCVTSSADDKRPAEEITVVTSAAENISPYSFCFLTFFHHFRPVSFFFRYHRSYSWSPAGLLSHSGDQEDP